MKYLSPQMLDAITLSSINIGSDHNLIMGKLCIGLQASKKKIPEFFNKINIESLENGVITNPRHFGSIRK